MATGLSALATSLLLIDARVTLAYMQIAEHWPIELIREVETLSGQACALMILAGWLVYRPSRLALAAVFVLAVIQITVIPETLSFILDPGEFVDTSDAERRLSAALSIVVALGFYAHALLRKTGPGIEDLRNDFG